MKRVLAIILAMFMILSLVACGSDGGSGGGTDKKSNKPTIEDTVIYDENGIKLTVKGFMADDDQMRSFLPDGELLEVFIENNTDQDITVMSGDKAIVNGCYVFDDSGHGGGAGAGGTGALWWTLKPKYLKEFGVEYITDITISPVITGANGETLYEVGKVNIETSKKGEYEQSRDMPGDVIYDQGGIKITAKLLEDADDEYSSNLRMLYVENTTGKDYQIYLKDVNANGASVSYVTIFTGFAYVFDGTIGGDYLSVSKDSLSNNNIENVERVDFKLEFHEIGNWDSYFVTDVITINF